VSAPPPTPPIREELVAFIAATIPSVWALETLLLLRRPPRGDWRADQIVAELRASPTLVDDCLEGLQRAGVIIGSPEGVRYGPASPMLANLCDQLEAAYRERPVAIVNLIASRRPDPLKGFADSFRFRSWKQ
jgi:hypothetical protein